MLFARIDELDEALLRLGTIEDGCLADTLNADLKDRMARCERLVEAGLMARGEEFTLDEGGIVRAYHTTPAGVVRQRAFWMATAGLVGHLEGHGSEMSQYITWNGGSGSEAMRLCA